MADYVAEWASPAPPRRIDKANGLVEGVRILNARSRNARKYPAKVTAAAARLYDGAVVNINHHLIPGTERPGPVPPEARFGRLSFPRPGPGPGGGLIADLRYNVGHRFASQFLWACEFDPGQYSFSPLHKVLWANGGRPDADGDMVAEQVLQVVSVDIVTDGGSTSTVFESFSPRPPLPPGRLAAWLHEGATARPRPSAVDRWLAAAVA